MTVGGVTPFPPISEITVIIDLDAVTLNTVFCGIGPNDRTLEIRLSDLIDVVQPRVAPIAQVRKPAP